MAIRISLRPVARPLARRLGAVLGLAALGLAAALPATVQAQTYPARALRMVVPFAPGGGTDILGRVIGATLANAIGQQVVIENRAGAGGNLGTGMVATAPGDGYTILIVSASYSVNAAVFKLNFDPLKDLAAVIQIASVPFVLSAAPNLPANNVRELIALAQARPGGLNYASSGNGSSPHLAGELFNLMAKTNIVHVPYKGGGPAMTDVMAGQVQMIFNTVIQSAPLVKSGKLKAIAVAGMQRASALPEVPTINESGLPGFDVSNWFGILVPGTTPRPIIATLNRHLAGLLSNPEVKQKLANEGADPVGGTAEDFDKLIRADIDKFNRIVKAANIKVE